MRLTMSLPLMRRAVLAMAVLLAAPLLTAKPAAAGSFGGMAALHVTAPGTYRVALGSGAWVDLLGNGQFLPSAGHGHGPACSGIRKIVDFALQPGDYVLQVAGSTTATVTVLVVPQG